MVSENWTKKKKSLTIFLSALRTTLLHLPLLPPISPTTTTLLPLIFHTILSNRFIVSPPFQLAHLHLISLLPMLCFLTSAPTATTKGCIAEAVKSKHHLLENLDPRCPILVRTWVTLLHVLGPHTHTLVPWNPHDNPLKKPLQWWPNQAWVPEPWCWWVCASLLGFDLNVERRSPWSSRVQRSTETWHVLKNHLQIFLFFLF